MTEFCFQNVSPPEFSRFNNDTWFKLTRQNVRRPMRRVFGKILEFGFRITKKQYFALVYIESKYCFLMILKPSLLIFLQDARFLFKYIREVIFGPTICTFATIGHLKNPLKCDDHPLKRKKIVRQYGFHYVSLLLDVLSGGWYVAQEAHPLRMNNDVKRTAKHCRSCL